MPIRDRYNGQQPLCSRLTYIRFNWLRSRTECSLYESAQLELFQLKRLQTLRGKRDIPVESRERYRMLEESDPISAAANDPAHTPLPIGAGNSA